MYNDLEPVRRALKPEPIIPASSYLRGLLSEPKSTVSAGIVPLTSTSGSGSSGSGSGSGSGTAISRIIQRKISRDEKLEKEMTEYDVKEGEPPYSKGEMDQAKANMISMSKKAVIERSNGGRLIYIYT